MKAVHVANTNDIRIYYLVESDDKSTGVLVKRGQAPVFINFFSYVSKKPNIKKIMDSEFHEFLWTGNKGSMRPRWEHMFIDRVAGSNSLLEGVNIITKFKTDNDESERRKKMEAKANHAIEYKSLVSSGLNEKAFANRIGRTAGRVASGSVRGFRRGVRFDPNAVDADMDGFVQEGTQFARPAVPKVRTDLRLEGMRSMQHEKDRFLPHKPKKPVTNSRVDSPEKTKKMLKKYKEDLKEYENLLNEVNRISGGAKEGELLIEHFDSIEDQLRELIGGREIETVDDVREIAAQLHSGFEPNNIQSLTGIIDNGQFRALADIPKGDIPGMLAHTESPHTAKFDRDGGSYWDLIDPNNSGSKLGHYEKAVALGVLESLMNSDYSKNTLDIRTGPTGSPEGYASANPNLLIDFDKNTEPFISEALQTLNDWRVARGERPYTKRSTDLENWRHAVKHYRQGRNGQEFLDKMDSLKKEIGNKVFDDLENIGFVDTSKHPKSRLNVVMDSNKRGSYYGAFRHNGFTHANGDPMYVDSKGEGASLVQILVNGTPSTSASAAMALMQHADTLPLEERKKVWAKAGQILTRSIVSHEMNGHDNHYNAIFKWLLATAGDEGAPYKKDGGFKKVVNTFKSKIRKKLSTDKNAMGLLGSMHRDHKEFNAKGVFSLGSGLYGPNVDVLVKVDVSSGSIKSAGIDDSFAMHEMSLTTLIKMAKRDGRSTDDVAKWLSQPVLDSKGNSFVANEELAAYFEQLAPHAKKLWDLDLTINSGEDLTLGHVLFGMNPIAVKNGTDGTRVWDRSSALPGYKTSKDRTGNFQNLQQKVHLLQRETQDVTGISSSGPVLWGELADVTVASPTPAIKKGTDKWAQAMADSHAGIMRDDVFEYEPGSHPGALPKLDENNDPVIKMNGTEPSYTVVSYPGKVQGGPPIPAGMTPAMEMEVYRPDLTMFRQFGMPPLDHKSHKRQSFKTDNAKQTIGQGVSETDFDTDLKTDHIPPSALAPLLDAHTAADVVIEKRYTKVAEKLESDGKTMDLDETLKGLTSIKFDNPEDHDQKIGAVGSDLKYSDLHGLSEAQQEEMLEQVTDDILKTAIIPLTQPPGVEESFLSEEYISETVRTTDGIKGQMLLGLGIAAGTWDDLSDTDISTLENLVDGFTRPDVGQIAYGSVRQRGYSSMLLEVLGHGRMEAIAELMAHLSHGINIPAYDTDGKFRDLTATEIAALKRLWYWIKADKNPPVRHKPRIRSNGVTYDVG